MLDRVGDAVVKLFERHNKAMATAKKLSNETGKTLKKAGKVAGAVAKGAGEGVKMAGNAAKVAHKVATEEVEVDEKVVYGGTPAKKEKPKMLVTRADKLGGTRAYKNMTAGDKRYKAADHLTSQVEKRVHMRLRLRERLKAAYEVTSPYIVDEGYRVVSKSYKHGDGKPEDDVTIKREKKVVSGDNLTRKGANQSKERRGESMVIRTLLQFKKPEKQRRDHQMHHLRIK